jgi:hypothetical protein
MTAAPASAATPSSAEVLKRAEAAYRRGMKTYSITLEARKHFARAAACYEELRRRGFSNPDLYHNLGQSCLLAGDLPRAILAYHHGLRLDPGNAALQDRLEDARGQVAYTVAGSFGRPPVDNWPPWLPRLPLHVRLAVVVVLFCLACLAVTRWWMTRQGWLLWVISPAFTTLAFLGAGLVLEARDRRWEADHPLVVVTAPRVVLHKGDGANYPCYDAQSRTWLDTPGTSPPEATPLPRGVEARLRFDKGDWLQIELAGGEIGWVRRKGVVIDQP